MMRERPSQPSVCNRGRALWVRLASVKPERTRAPLQRTSAPCEDENDIRQKAKQGGLYLIVRRGFDIALGVFGLLFLTRLAGPHAYGLFTAAFSLVRFIGLLSDSGIKMYLLRTRRETSLETFHQAFWWLIFSGFALTVVSMGAVSLFGWLKGDAEGFTAVALIMCLSIPLSILSGVPLALLERALRYQQVAFVEIFSQIVYYTVGIALALCGYGVWAFVGGFWSSQIILFVGYHLASNYRPQWYWNKTVLRDLIGESFKMVSASWIYELRLLGPSLILLPLAGATAVGYYALGYRLFITLGFMRDAIARLAVPLYAHFQHEPTQLLKTAYRAAQAQLLVAGIPFVILAMAGYFLLPIIFGTRWNIPIVMLIFSILATNNLFFVIFGAQTQALLVVRKSHVFLRSGLLYVVLSFILSALLTMVLQEPYRVVGYTLGTVLAYLPHYFLMDRGTRRYIGTPQYGVNLLWAGCLGMALFASIFGYWLLAGLLALLHPVSQKEIFHLVHELRKMRSQSRGKGVPANAEHSSVEAR